MCLFEFCWWEYCVSKIEPSQHDCYIHQIKYLLLLKTVLANNQTDSNNFAWIQTLSSCYLVQYMIQMLCRSPHGWKCAAESTLIDHDDDTNLHQLAGILPKPCEWNALDSLIVFFWVYISCNSNINVQNKNIGYISKRMHDFV